MVDNHCNIILLNAADRKLLRRVDCGFREPVAVNDVLYDEHCIWISTTAHGILHYNTENGRLLRLRYLPASMTNGLTHDDVYKVVKLSDRKYLAVTWNGYTMLTVDKENPDVIATELFNNTSSVVHRNLETRMIAVYYDAQGIIWIGTEGGGVIWSDLRMQFYNRFYQDRHNEICSILADDDGYIWLATFHKGVMRSDTPFDTAGGKLNFTQAGTAEVKGVETVLCGLKDETGNLWFGNQDGTLTFYDKRTRQFSVRSLTTEEGVNRASVWALFIDSRHRFWIGTRQGLLLLDRKLGSCRKIDFKPASGKELPTLYIRAIAETADHSLWIGTANCGICRMTKDYTLYTGYEEEHHMAENSVRSLLASSDGNLYIGYMTGLAILSPSQDAITKVYTTHDGLCSNFIGCITEDMQGQIWIGSNSGISRYSRHQRLFYNYYITGSNRSALCYDGVLFWGNNKSLTYFTPEDIKAFAVSESVAITRLEVNNKPVEIGKEINGQVILSQSIHYTRMLTLNHDNRDFSLIFNNLSYSEGQQKYSYRLRPYQPDWMLADGGEKVSYANLPAGKYVFEVKNIYPDERSGAVTTLTVRILPHWSETLIFRFFIFLLVILVIYMAVRRIKLRQKRLKHELQLEHEVFTANMERDKEKQIRMERENFFTNAAHELRTPLTLILSPISELLHAVNPAEPIYAKLSMIYRNGESLHTLVDQLLYVQKIEAGMVKLRISEADVVNLVQEIADSFRALAEARNLRFVVRLPQEPLFLWIDVEKIASAVRNLLSNAFKYTPPGGRVMLSVCRTVIDDMPCCSLCVADTGKGIPLKLQDRIFDSFITGDNNPLLSTKVGIGMRIVKNTMDLHHGTVTLDSTPEKGSVFTLFVPEGKAHFDSDSYEIIEASSVGRQDAPVLPAVAEVGEEKTENRRSLLVIEDNPEVRGYVCSLFSKAYTVWEAADGQQGVDMALEKVPDLIISDVMMPVKDGFACCREIREHVHTAHIPILMLTAKAEDVDRLQASGIGVDDYMMKPFNPELLKSRVENLILQRERLKRLYTKMLMLKQPEASGEPEASVTDDFIRQVVNVIEAHLSDETFNVKILAEQLNMSQPTLYRKIKQSSDLSAIDMIRSIRMSKAASLIMTHRYTIQEIAGMVGYSDTRTLRKHFTEQFGVSPSKYIDKD